MVSPQPLADQCKRRVHRSRRLVRLQHPTVRAHAPAHYGLVGVAGLVSQTDRARGEGGDNGVQLTVKARVGVRAPSATSLRVGFGIAMAVGRAVGLLRRRRDECYRAGVRVSDRRCYEPHPNTILEA